MELKTKVRFTNSKEQDALGFGKGIVQLLEGVDELGSINQATKQMGMAYSKAWKIVKSIEAEFGVQLIDRDGAHGSVITDEARRMMQAYYEALQAADDAANKVFRKYFDEK